MIGATGKIRSRYPIKKFKVQPFLKHSTRNSSLQDSFDKLFLSPKEIFRSRSFDFFSDYLVCISRIGDIGAHTSPPSSISASYRKKEKTVPGTRGTNLKDITDTSIPFALRCVQDILEQAENFEKKEQFCQTVIVRHLAPFEPCFSDRTLRNRARKYGANASLKTPKFISFLPIAPSKIDHS